MYASLNIHKSFPEPQGLDLEFIWILLMACDLKNNIHQRAIGSFFEWDKLDCAIGGLQQALGNLLSFLRKLMLTRAPRYKTPSADPQGYLKKIAGSHDGPT
ncbi:hypothetical protein SERLA73DRAFT_80334 [Serpula lacrymans var. lacrymans S7.3]|uniref:Uncharacterized protein n=1 Tax=Serpula lacrymans var. lacrymans (strain S7.3) TaxID=936435 RepID=F8QJG2_SERL3|nr:hypothetical protein SERLA73DRAFT_80334 [Serpula lacrymans var. lacrymans S7.3]